MNEFRPVLDDVLRVMSEKSYRIKSSPAGFDLDLVGVWTPSKVPHRFYDWLTVIYVSHGRRVFLPFPVTTYPGLFWRGGLREHVPLHAAARAGLLAQTAED